MKPTNYKGWKIMFDTNPRHPDLIVAERYGVTMRANDLALLQRMIDNRDEPA
jgi:hypothetical protein